MTNVFVSPPDYMLQVDRDYICSLITIFSVLSFFSGNMVLLHVTDCTLNVLINALVFINIWLCDYYYSIILYFVNTFSPGNMYNMCVCAKSLHLCLTLCDPWTVAHQTATVYTAHQYIQYIYCVYIYIHTHTCGGGLVAKLCLTIATP